MKTKSSQEVFYSNSKVLFRTSTPIREKDEWELPSPKRIYNGIEMGYPELFGPIKEHKEEEQNNESLIEINRKGYMSHREKP